MSYTVIIVDDPAPYVRRITMNRPEKRNALDNALRGEIIDCLQRNDQDPAIRVTILRGGGSCFSSGYDLGAGLPESISAGDGISGLSGLPSFTAPGDGQWPRHVVDEWTGIWDLAKPVIAQVHGYCLAGGSDLATGCDLVYVAEDAQMGYPAVRFGVPDMQFHAWLIGMRAAMEMTLTGDSISGVEAVRLGWANRAYPADELGEQVVAIASRIAKTGPDLLQINKRSVHRGMEIMGIRTAVRAGTELCAIGSHTASSNTFMKTLRDQGLNKALTDRDEKFGDYRTAGSPGSA